GLVKWEILKEIGISDAFEWTVLDTVGNINFIFDGLHILLLVDIDLEDLMLISL
ncbi:hypothetical protein PanWU01x14_309510, partial [Parasponia andersonii]